MVNEERDRYGDKIKEAERGREDDYFARRDRELLQKMRDAATARCPACDATLPAGADGARACPQCAEP